MNKLILGLAGMLAFAAPCAAATDWNAAAEAWRSQYRELAIADAAHRECDIDAPRPVRRALRELLDGLHDTLASIGPVEKPRAIVKAQGGKEKFCANQTLMNEAKATIEKLSAQRKESGANVKLPLAPPQAGAPVAANAPTPVIDPNIALIRNCRQAVVAKLDKRAKNNDAFWSTYESCMKDQGAGWF